MDKIDLAAASLLNASRLPVMKQDAKKTHARGALSEKHKTFFSNLLDKSAEAHGGLGALKEPAPSEEALAELADAVHNTGSDLIERPFAGEILRYKQAVRDFLHYVVENGYDVYKVQGIKKKTFYRGEADWKTVIYNQVKVIDAKLDETAAAILSGQTSQLQRVAQVNEIKGLLVDLTISGAIVERQ